MRDMPCNIPDTVQIYQYNEAWEWPEDGEPVFSHNKVILRDGMNFFSTTTKDRSRSVMIADLQSSKIQPIPSPLVWPPFSPEWKILSSLSLLPSPYYIKGPNLLTWDEYAGSESPSNLLAHEAEVCEHLRKHPHPNIATYFGCLVEHDRLTGLCFEKYDQTLAEASIESSERVDAILAGIEAGMKHLHDLGYVHMDLTESNVMLSGDRPVLIDFDCAHRKGAKLGAKMRDYDPSFDDIDYAECEFDFFGLEKIREFLIGRLRST